MPHLGVFPIIRIAQVVPSAEISVLFINTVEIVLYFKTR